jgi:hypothetical protein
MNPAAITKRREFIITKITADLEPIFPEGSSLLLVLGLRASNFLSANLLKAIAAFLAKIMHKIIRISSLMLKLFPSPQTASENPINANGMANTVWLNLTSDR